MNRVTSSRPTRSPSVSVAWLSLMMIISVSRSFTVGWSPGSSAYSTPEGMRRWSAVSVMRSERDKRPSRTCSSKVAMSGTLITLKVSYGESASRATRSPVATFST